MYNKNFRLNFTVLFNLIGECLHLYILLLLNHLTLFLSASEMLEMFLNLALKSTGTDGGENAIFLLVFSFRLRGMHVSSFWRS